jgi:hypothetical protein
MIDAPDNVVETGHVGECIYRSQYDLSTSSLILLPTLMRRRRARNVQAPNGSDYLAFSWPVISPISPLPRGIA